ncbi:MAG: hypothetical protein RIR41_3178, partial [Pseudomonadota bacterium]
MQAADGPNSSQLEWHQDGVKIIILRRARRAGPEMWPSDAKEVSMRITEISLQGFRCFGNAAQAIRLEDLTTVVG